MAPLETIVTHAQSPDHARLQQRVAELEARLARYEALIEQFPGGTILAFDSDLRYTVAGGTSMVQFGMTKAQLEGRTIWEALPGEASSVIEPLYRAALDGQSSAMEMSFGEHTFELRILPLCGPDGTIETGMVVAVDISARRRAEQAAREQAELLQTVIDQMSDGVIVAEPDGRFAIFNSASQRLFGPNKDTARDDWSVRYGLFLPDQQTLFPPENLPLARALCGEETRDTEVFVRHVHAPDGLWVTVNGRPLYGSDGLVRGGIVVCRDETERRRNAAEQAQLQETIIRMQSAALRELSTPLIPISDRVMVMPLIGTVDSHRAEQVMETLLEGIAKNRARVAIVDITGVPVVDTQVANALLRSAQTARLLGARVVLTGIRPEVAQTLVGLGIGLEGLVTRGTLQSGIAYAMGDL